MAKPWPKGRKARKDVIHVYNNVHIVKKCIVMIEFKNTRYQSRKLMVSDNQQLKNSPVPG